MLLIEEFINNNFTTAELEEDLEVFIVKRNILPCIKSFKTYNFGHYSTHGLKSFITFLLGDLYNDVPYYRTILSERAKT